VKRSCVRRVALENRGHLCSDGGDPWCSSTGIVKVDMTAPVGEGLVKRLEFPPNTAGGEASFVPRDADAMLRGECDDDDGWLVTYVSDFSEEDNHRSSCMV
jgi:carotenoid cleavage dioxygenase-like enzyme